MWLKEIKEESKYELTKIYFITLNDTDNIYQIIKYCSKLSPIPKYLKRIHKGKNSIKCLVSMNSISEYILINDVKYLLEHTYIPNRHPINKKEYEEFQTFWSFNFFTEFVKKFSFHESFVHLILPYKREYVVECSTACLIVDSTTKHMFPIESSSYLPWNHGIFKSIKHVSQSEYGYLCTNLDIYVLGNPCFGCCCALLHSKISNVFLVNIETNNVFSKYFIHQNINFNHKFRVFEVMEK